LAKKLKQFLSGRIPDLDLSEVSFKANSPTRNTSGAVLQYLADKIDNMIVMSADLSNSDKTEGFIKGGRKSLTRGDFSGGFIHAGVSELTMAAIANGIAIHSGIFVACGTFFVFSDYMKPAIRLSALMELPVIFIWTHDAFRVGEDGPTHQPIEHEAQIRLLEKLKNHSGNNSMLVLRPADAQETIVSWDMALKNSKSPTGLILSRQAVNDLPATKGKSRAEVASEAVRGAYIVLETDTKPDIILLGNGSEVSLLLETAELLKKEKNLKVQVVSAISEGLFRNQDKDYQLKVIPEEVPVFGLTAGLPVVLQGFTGNNGFIYGVDHFGYSAPAHVLDEKFGFYKENIYKEVCKFLGV
jgi:transketolase